MVNGEAKGGWRVFGELHCTPHTQGSGVAIGMVDTGGSGFRVTANTVMAAGRKKEMRGSCTEAWIGDDLTHLRA